MKPSLAAALCLCSLSACGHAGANPPQAPAVASHAQARAALTAAIGAAECRDDRECKAVAVGHKPCGGPAGYLVYSTRGGNAERIETLANEERAAAKAAEKPGLVSDCAIVEPPYVSCRAGHCAVGASER